MPIVARVTPNLYKDSVALMRVAEAVLAAPGVRRATLVMGTPANKEILEEAGLLTREGGAAGPSDLIFVVDADNEGALAAANDIAARALAGRSGASDAGGAGVEAIVPRSIGAGVRRLADARLAQISVPGVYAGAEALKAVKAGLHVFLFSDNVPLAEERRVKTLARERGLLVMGPDCGTAIIGGVPLGFANVVRRGSIGLVAASGTGLQEVTTQIHLAGAGVSHAIGTGGRDVSAAVGGITMLQGIDLLAADPATQVIVILSKPPAPEITERVLARLEHAGKPSVVLFLGERITTPANCHPARTLFDAAAIAVRLAGHEAAQPSLGHAPAAAGAPSQRFIRALFSGGTYCSEAQVIWRDLGINAWSNVPLDKARKLADARASREHTAVDLGEDEFTVGRPHPMIDLGSRIERLAQEAADPTTAVVLLDVVLGYGAHADPAGGLASAIRAARASARAAGRDLAVVSFVCGTDDDPQRRSAQEATLAGAGAIVLASSSAAAEVAARLVLAR